MVLPEICRRAGSTVNYLALSLVSVFFLLILFAAECIYRLTKVPPEWTRKFQHVVSGLLAACFPWIFSTPIEVAALGAIMTLVMLVLRKSRFLTSLHDVKRESLGEIYFVLSVVILSFLAWDKPPVYYLIPILTLTISDTLAAIVGTAYKKRLYSITGHIKSLEGSAAFLISTLLTTSLPLLFLAGMPLLLSVLIAFNTAVLVTGVEAVCRKGSDNLFIPLSTFYLLVYLTSASVSLLTLELAGLLGLASFLTARLSRRTSR